MIYNNHTCASGHTGWQAPLRENYQSYDEWFGYSETYGLAERLGYESAERAWDINPIVEGSTSPGDFAHSDREKYALREAVRLSIEVIRRHDAGECGCMKGAANALDQYCGADNLTCPDGVRGIGDVLRAALEGEVPK